MKKNNKMQETEKIESYEDLKENLLRKIGNIDVNSIKTYFQQEVESERTFHNIDSVRKLITTLEERDIINEDNLNILCDILKFCQKENLLNESVVNEMEEEISFYKKEFDCPSTDICQICLNERELNHVLPSAPELSPIHLNLNQATAPLEEFVSPKITEIDIIINYISKHIDEDWRAFASFLGVKENVIQDLYNRYNKQNKAIAAYEALSEWKRRSYRKSEHEKKEILIKYLQRDTLYYLSDIAEGINNGEHWRHLQMHNLVI